MTGSAAIRVLQEDQNFVLALYLCGCCYSALGVRDEAVACLQTVMRFSDRLPIYVAMSGQAHARAGQRADAEALLQELRQRADGEYVPPVATSWIAMALGDADRAFEPGIPI